MTKEEHSKAIGELVRVKRESKGWSQSELAAKVGNNFQNISRLERGEVAPTVFWMTTLAQAFGMTLSDFIKEFENEHYS